MSACAMCAREVKIGDWPFCPHGPYNQKAGFQEYVDDVSFPQDEVITSAAHADRLAKKHNLVERGGVDNKKWF